MAGTNQDAKDMLSKMFEDGFKPYMDTFIKYFNTNFDRTSIINILDKIDESSSNIIQTFGVGRERIFDIKSSMGDALSSIYELGGELGNIESIQMEVSNTLKRNLVLTSDSFKDLYALTLVTGKGVGELTSSFKDVGISLYQMTDRVNEALAISQKMGVNGRDVIGAMMNNMDALNKFNFEGGTEGLAKMAAHAASLRFNMRETLNLADKVFNPEGAIQVAAAMQRLGVAQSDLLDPLRLMDLSQNDPAELQKQLEQMSKSFVKMKADGTFEILPGEKRRLMEIESQLGMTQGTLAKLALSSSEMSEKMKKIRFGGDFTEEEQRFIASISEIGKGGDMSIRLEGKNLGIGEALEKFRDDPEKLKELMKPQDALELAKEQTSTVKNIFNSVKSIADRTGAAIGGSQEATELQDAGRKIASLIPRVAEAPGLTTESIRKDLIGSMGQLMKDYLGGAGNQETLLNLATNLKGYGDKFDKFPEHALKVISKFDDGSNKFIQLGDKIFGLTEALNAAGFPDLKSAIDALVNKEPSTKIKGEDFVVETLPQDSIRVIGNNIVGGTNLDGGVQQSGTKSEMTINLKLDVDGSKSPNLNIDDLKRALNDSSVVDAVKKAVDNATNNFGRSGKTDPLKSNMAK